MLATGYSCGPSDGPYGVTVAQLPLVSQVEPITSGNRNPESEHSTPKTEH